MEFTPEQADAHNALTKAAWDIVNAEIIIHGGKERGAPGFFARRKLQRAAGLFWKALEINPEGWSSMWALGKIYQRLGDHERSYQWFLRARSLNPDQPDVAREAGLAAMDAGRVEEALELCLAAVHLSPDDLGLRCNLALAYLLAGDDSNALECASIAANGDPGDDISQNVLAFVRDVRDGRKPRPRKLGDAFPVV